MAWIRIHRIPIISLDSNILDPDHVHLPRGQVGGPAQPERGAQLPPPPLRARTQALRARTQALRARIQALRARTQAIRTRTHDLILLLAEIELFLYSIFLRRVTTVASSQIDAICLAASVPLLATICCIYILYTGKETIS